MWETWVLSLGWEDPLEKGKAILVWRIPWTIQSMGSQSRTRLSYFHLHLHLPSPRERLILKFVTTRGWV